jgi:hypothetical protein
MSNQPSTRDPINPACPGACSRSRFVAQKVANANAIGGAR